MLPLIMGAISAAGSVLGAAVKDTPSNVTSASGGPFQMGDYIRITGSPGASASTSKTQPYINSSGVPDTSMMQPYGSDGYGGNSSLLIIAAGGLLLLFLSKG